MKFRGVLYFRCKRCSYLISVSDVLGYYPNIGDEIIVKCPNCGEEH